MAKAAAGDLTRDGYPVSSFWAFAFTGLNEEDGAPEFDFFDAENDPNVKLDATTYMKHMGKMDPDLSAGLSTSIRYKSFTLSAGFSLQIGGKKFLAPVFDDSMINTTPNEYNNLPKSLVNRWRKPSDKQIFIHYLIIKKEIPNCPMDNILIFIACIIMLISGLPMHGS